MAPAHGLAPLHALPSEQEERMADPAPGKHSDAVSEAQVGMLSASELATCLCHETVRSLPCRAALGYAGMPQISGLHLVEVHSLENICARKFTSTEDHREYHSSKNYGFM